VELRDDILCRERHVMSRVKDLESQIRELSAEEMAAFREWFTKFDADNWDREFEADAKAGKLDAAAESALRDHSTGRSTKL
jgi:hypothetical protein